MAAIDWGILIVAGSSLIFAVIAFKKVMVTTSRIDALLDKIPKNPLKLFTPEWAADALRLTITKDIKNPDGSPVAVTDVITGYMNAYGPAVMARFEAKLPELIPLLLADNPSPPQAGQSAGAQLAGQRWGGLKGAQAAINQVNKTSVGGKLGGMAQEALELAKAGMEIKKLMSDFRGAGENGGQGPAPASPGPSHGSNEWRPPV